MSGQELMMELGEKVKTLDQALLQIKKRGKDYAQAEHDYRVELSKKMLEEREKGTPASILGDVCRGSGEIARLRLKRDVGEAMYKAAVEACNVYKLQLRILESQIEREYRG